MNPRWLVARDARGRCIATQRMPGFPGNDDTGTFNALSLHREVREFLLSHFPEGQWMEVAGSKFQIRGPQSQRLGSIEAQDDRPADDAAR